MRQIAHPHVPTHSAASPVQWLSLLAVVALLCAATFGVIALIDDDGSNGGGAAVSQADQGSVSGDRAVPSLRTGPSAPVR